MTRRLYAQLLPVLLVTLALSACAFDPPTIERTPREIANTDGTAKGRLARRGAAATQASPDISGEEIQVPGEEVAALEVDLTNFKERLIGLDSDEVNDLLGTPSLERAEPPALIWQFRGTACTVDIFMFDDGAGSTVDHVEVRGAGDKEKADEKACFTGLLRNTAALAPAKNAPPPPTPIAGPAKPTSRTAQPARGAPSAATSRSGARAPAAATAPAARTPASAPAAATAPAPAAPPAPAKVGEEFEEDDNGAPPAGAAAKATSEPIPELPPEVQAPAAPQAASQAAPQAAPKAAPKIDEFEIEADPDKAGPLLNEDDPASRNEDLVE